MLTNRKAQSTALCNLDLKHITWNTKFWRNGIQNVNIYWLSKIYQGRQHSQCTILYVSLIIGFVAVVVCFLVKYCDYSLLHMRKEDYPRSCKSKGAEPGHKPVSLWLQTRPSSLCYCPPEVTGHQGPNQGKSVIFVLLALKGLYRAQRTHFM